MTQRATTVVAGAAAMLLLVACGAGGTPSAAPTKEPSPPAAPSGPALQMAEPSGKWDLVLSDVRTGRQQGADRVVLDFTGTGAPGWAVEYVDEAVLEGSGDVVDVAGDTTLQISASGTTYPGADGEQYRGPTRIRPEGRTVAEVYVVGTFEGYTQVFVGLDGDAAPFHVVALPDPARLVVAIDDVG